MLKRNKSDSDLSKLFCQEIIEDPTSGNNSTILLTNTSTMTIDTFSMANRLNNFSNHNITTVSSVLFPNTTIEDTRPSEEEVKTALEAFYDNLKKKAMETAESTKLIDERKDTTHQHGIHVISHGLSAVNDDDPVKKMILQRKKESGVVTKVVKIQESNQVVEKEEVDFIKENIRQLKLQSEKKKIKRRPFERQPLFETDDENTLNQQIVKLSFNNNEPTSPTHLKIFDVCELIPINLTKNSPRHTNLLTLHSAKKQLFSNLPIPSNLPQSPHTNCPSIPTNRTSTSTNFQPHFFISSNSVPTPRLSTTPQPLSHTVSIPIQPPIARTNGPPRSFRRHTSIHVKN